MISEKAVRERLTTEKFGGKIYTFEKIDSTNNCGRALAECWAPEGTVIIAEEQTAGRGRLGRSWQANPNENLTFSIVLRPTIAPEALNLLPLYVAVAVADAVESRGGIKVECKWPNDLLTGGKKFAGVLLEGSVKQNSLEYVVIGIGINVNQRLFSGELEQRATSLRLATGMEIDRTGLFCDLLSSLERHYRNLCTKGFQSIVPLWLSRSSMIGREISVSQQGTVLSGIVKGLSMQGGLILQSHDIQRTLFAGDVTIIGT